MTTAVERLRDALAAHGCTPRGTAAKCPAHDDRRASLSIGPARNFAGAVVNCQVGCETGEILAVIGLTMADLYDEPHPNGQTKPTRTVKCDYEYHDENGKVLYGKRRFDPKGFLSWQPLRGGGKQWNLEGVQRRVLYRLPQVKAAIAADDTIWISEGEKDVQALERAGVIATTWIEGASLPGARPKWRHDYSQQLTGAHVIIVQDRDDAGRQTAKHIAAELKQHAASVEIIEPAKGKDASDHLTAGLTITDFVQVADAAPETEEPQPDDHDQKADQGKHEPGRKLKATKVLDIRMTATRWLWEDGPHCWIPMGALVGLGGREGVGKSTVCAHLVAKVTKGELPGDFYGTPKGVIIVSTEDDWSATIKPRLVAAGAHLDRVFRVNAIEPDGLEGTLSLPEDLKQLEGIIREHDVALVILDPLLTMVHKGLDTHKDAEVRIALDPIVRMAHDTNVSLIGLVHVNKSNEGDLLNRIMASRALTAVPRAFLFCAKYWQSLGAEDEDPDFAALNGPRTEFVFGQIKNNLAAKVMISLRYHMETEIVGHDDEAGKEIGASKLFINERHVDQNIEDIVLEQEKARKGVKTQGGKAKQWLVGFLAGKGEVPSNQVITAGEDAGLSSDAIHRGRRDLGERLVVRNLPVIPRQTTWRLLEK